MSIKMRRPSQLQCWLTWREFLARQISCFESKWQFLACMHQQFVFCSLCHSDLFLYALMSDPWRQFLVSLVTADMKRKEQVPNTKRKGSTSHSRTQLSSHFDLWCFSLMIMLQKSKHQCALLRLNNNLWFCNSRTAVTFFFCAWQSNRRMVCEANSELPKIALCVFYENTHMIMAFVSCANAVPLKSWMTIACWKCVLKLDQDCVPQQNSVSVGFLSRLQFAASGGSKESSSNGRLTMSLCLSWRVALSWRWPVTAIPKLAFIGEWYASSRQVCPITGHPEFFCAFTRASLWYQSRTRTHLGPKLSQLYHWFKRDLQGALKNSAINSSD